MKKNVFIKKVFIYFIGTMSSNLLGIMLLPLYAYFVKSEDLGLYDYYVTIASIVAPVAYCAIWEAILRFGIKGGQEDKAVADAYKATAMRFFLINTLFLSIGGSILYFIIRKESVFWIILTGIVHGAAFIWQFAARSIGDNKGYTIAGIISSFLFVCGVAFSIVGGNANYKSLISFHLLSQLSIVLILEYRGSIFRPCTRNKMDKEKLREMIRFSFPLAMNNISLWLYSGANKIIIRKYVGVRENGLYSFSNKFSLLISLVSTIISLVLVEEVYGFRNIEEYRVGIKKLISVISKLYFGAIALALPAIYILYSLLFSHTEYYDSKDYVFVLLLAALFMALANNFGSSIQITGETEYVFITSICGAVCSLGFSIGMARSFGVYGVIWGGVIGYFVMMLARAIYAWKKTQLKIEWRQNIEILIFDVFSYLLLRKSNLSGEIIIFFVAVLFIMFMYRLEIKKICHRYVEEKGK